MRAPPSQPGPRAALEPTRTLATEFDEQTEIVRERDEDEDEHTLRGELIPEPEPLPGDEPTRIPPESTISTVPTPAAPPKVAPGPRLALLVLASLGVTIGILSAVLLR